MNIEWQRRTTKERGVAISAHTAWGWRFSSIINFTLLCSLKLSFQCQRVLLAGQAPFLPGIPAKKRGHQENVSGAQSASENNRSRGADGVEKEPAKCQLADRSPALHNREAQRARERKWHRQPTTALQIHLPFQNLQLYHFAISSSSLFFCNRVTHQRVRPEREGTLFFRCQDKRREHCILPLRTSTWREMRHVRKRRLLSEDACSCPWGILTLQAHLTIQQLVTIELRDNAR